MRSPSVDDVAEIVAIPDPIIRNLRITQCYAELAHAFSRMGPGAANWCTFATWASKQAGHSIRKEDLARAFERRFADSPVVRNLVDIVARHAGGRLPSGIAGQVERILRAIDPERIFDRVSDAVARGNRKVFEEIGREFARFIEAFRDASGTDEEALARFRDELLAGNPPDGQDRLREAFTAYAEARFDGDPASAAQLAFMANLLVGFHEQTRLQPEIREALDAAFAEAEAVKQRILRAVLPGFWVRLRHHAARFLGRPLPLDAAIDRLMDEVKRIAREIVTRSLMTLELPGETLLLGRDLAGQFPEALRNITSAPLRQLLAQIDPTTDSPLDSGATDWANLDQRMHFISDFFRTYHENPALLKPPFSDDQVAAMRRGERPDGRL